jgi:hypothetical protein
MKNVKIIFSSFAITSAFLLSKNYNAKEKKESYKIVLTGGPCAVIKL